MRSRLKGFTLIELVIVMVLIGILSAVALPRFLNLSSDAYAAKFKAIKASFNTEMSLFHVEYLNQGSPAAGTTVYRNLQTNAYGYPAGIDGDTAQGSGTEGAEDCIAIWNAVLNTPPSIVAYTQTELKNVVNSADFAVRTSTDGTEQVCIFYYIEPAKTASDQVEGFSYFLSDITAGQSGTLLEYAPATVSGL